MVKAGSDVRRLLILGAMLLLSAILLPEVIAEGGWRAWVATITSVGVLCFFVGGLWTLLRGRKSTD
jgi:hypothetical protein